MNNLLDFLWKNSISKANNLAYRFLERGDITGPQIEVTWLELANKVKATANVLQSQTQKGDRALLLYGPGLDFIIAIYACFAAGVIAVPSYPPDVNRLNRTLPRLQTIAVDAQANIVLTRSDLLAIAEPICNQTPGLDKLRWIATDQLIAKAQDWNRYIPKVDDIAFLQYTSGSTGDPKGVMISHSNLMSACFNWMGPWAYEVENPHQVSWLPTFHDLGLMWGLISPLLACVPCTFMAPVAFLEKPARWLEAITYYRGTMSAAPNFAFDLCIRKIDNDSFTNLDLSSLQSVINGAEPIKAETINAFYEKFKAVGFRAEVMNPSYGLAENTLHVSTTHSPSDLPTILNLSSKALEQGCVEVLESDANDKITIVGCGKKAKTTNKIAIVNPQTKEVVKTGVGEVWVSGPTVAQGYWGRKTLSKEIFQAHILGDETNTWLKTGDLGFLYKNELFITGRCKDLIIIRGRNIYPQDIEKTVEQVHSAIRPGCVAAFAMEKGGVEESIGFVAEVEVKKLGATSIESVLASLRSEILDEFEVSVDAIMLIEKGSIHKTSSGKIQRKACRNSLLIQDLPQVAFWTLESQLNPLVNKIVDDKPSLPTALNKVRTKSIKEKLDSLSERRRFSTLLSYVSLEIVEVLSLPSVSVLLPNMLLKDLGLDSLKAVEIRNRLSTLVQSELPSSLLFDYPTIEGLAKYLFDSYLYPTTKIDLSKFSDEEIKEILASIPIAVLRQSPLFEQLVELSQSELVRKNKLQSEPNKQKDKWVEMDTAKILKSFGVSE